MERDVERVAEIYEALRRRKVADVLLGMAPEVEITQSPELPWGGVYHGQEGVRRFFSRLAEHLDNRLEVERLIDAGDRVVVVGRTLGTARATKLEFEVPFVHVWTFQGGQITGLESYLDNGTILAVLQTPELGGGQRGVSQEGAEENR